MNTSPGNETEKDKKYCDALAAAVPVAIRALRDIAAHSPSAKARREAANALERHGLAPEPSAEPAGGVTRADKSGVAPHEP
jgi:hypothetical protein